MEAGEQTPGSTMDLGDSEDHGHAVVARGTDDLPLGSAVTASGAAS